MSIFALLPASRDSIRSACSLDRDECRVMPGPKPPPVCGDRFISVFGLSWTPGDTDLNRGLDEYYGVGVAITYRCAFLQFDDMEEELYLKQGSGMDFLARQIIKTLHQSIELMTAANKLITGGWDFTHDIPTNTSIIEPLRWQSGDSTPTLVGSDWFSSTSSSKEAGESTAGIVLQVNFEQARRIQAWENIS